jgi:TRAP-type mannitol/chloroaromatic compound transport system permease small subunit
MRQPSPSTQATRLAVLADRIDWFNDLVGRGAAWCTLAIVLLVACNVTLRYVLRIGPVWMQELEWHLVSPIALIGMAYAMRYNEHVRVDMFYEKFGPAMRGWVDLAAAVTTLAIAAAIFKLSFAQVEYAFTSLEGSTDPGGLPYRYLLKSFIPIGFALVALQAVGQGARSILAIKAGDRRG